MLMIQIILHERYYRLGRALRGDSPSGYTLVKQDAEEVNRKVYSCAMDKK